MAKKKAPAFSSAGGYKFIDNGKTTAVLDADGRFTLKDDNASLEVYETWRDFVKHMEDTPTTSEDEVEILTQLENLGLGKAEAINLEERITPPTDQAPVVAEPEIQKKKEEMEMAKVAKKAKKPAAKAAKEKKVKELHPCPCGCGEKTERTFAQGHDARVHGWMKKIERGEAKFEDFKKVAQDFMREQGTKQGVAKPKAEKVKKPAKAKAAKKAAKAAE